VCRTGAKLPFFKQCGFFRFGSRIRIVDVNDMPSAFRPPGGGVGMLNTEAWKIHHYFTVPCRKVMGLSLYLESKSLLYSIA